MTDELTAAATDAATIDTAAPVTDAIVDAPAAIAVGDIVRGRPVFGVRKVEGVMLVAFDPDCAWQPL